MVFFLVKNIFLSKKLLIIILFFCLIFITFFYISFLFFAVLLWTVYFCSCYFFYKLFKYKKCQELDLRLYNYIVDKYTKELHLGNFLVFLKNFFFYQPKFLAYKYYYNLAKNFNEKEKKKETNAYFLILFILVSLIFVLPIKLFIKWLTGFSYFSIKISSICTNQMLDILESDWEWKNFYEDVIEMFLQSISSYFFTSLFIEVKDNKIYFNFNGVDIYFNPGGTAKKIVDGVLYHDVLKELDFLKQSFVIASKTIKPANVFLDDVVGPNKIHNGAIFQKKDSPIKIVYVESNQKQIIMYADGKTQPLLLPTYDGMSGFKNVNIYNAFTTEESSIKISQKLKHYSDSNVHTLEGDKFNIYKGLLLSYFEKHIILENGSIKEDQVYDNFWDKIQYMYDRKELPQSLVYPYEYCVFFLNQNGLSPINYGPRSPGSFARDEMKIRELYTQHKSNVIVDFIKNTTYQGKIIFPEHVGDSPQYVKNSVKHLIDSENQRDNELEDFV